MKFLKSYYSVDKAIVVISCNFVKEVHHKVCTLCFSENALLLQLFCMVMFLSVNHSTLNKDF